MMEIHDTHSDYRGPRHRRGTQLTKRLGLVAVWPLVVALSGLGFPAYGAVTCAFQSRGGLALAFGALNPAVGANVTVTATAMSLSADTWGNCPNTTMSMTADSGLNGSRRMTNGTAFIQYSLALPANANGPAGNAFVPFILTGTVLGTDYINAPAGSYSDTVQITVTP
jgi:spore coat protein U-like protein